MADADVPATRSERERYQQAEVSWRQLWSRIRVSGPAIEVSRQESGAFQRAMIEEYGRIQREWQKELARMMYTEGKGMEWQVEPPPMTWVGEEEE